MATINCTWEEFKRMAKEFHEAAPTLDIDELDNAWKCLGIAYLGMLDPMWQHSSYILLNMEMRTYVQRELELLSQDAFV